MYTKMGLVSESKIALYLFFFFYVTIFKVFIECVATLLLLFTLSFGLEVRTVIAPQPGIEPTPQWKAKSEPLDCPGSLSINLSDKQCCVIRVLCSENSA